MENDEVPKGKCLEKFLLVINSKFYMFSFTEPDFLMAGHRREGTCNFKMEASHKTDQLHPQKNHLYTSRFFPFKQLEVILETVNKIS